MRKFVCAAMAFAICAVVSFSADDKEPKKEMKHGGLATIKKIDAEKGTLTVSFKKGDEDKVLEITDDTVFLLRVGGEKKEIKGKEGLKHESFKEGEMVTVIMDKDGKVIRVRGPGILHDRVTEKKEERKEKREEKREEKKEEKKKGDD